MNLDSLLKNAMDNSDHDICVACKQKITTGQVVTAKEQPYHQNCFKCSSCKALIHSNFISEKGKFICDKCFDINTFSCARCHQKIGQDFPDFVEIANVKLHKTCYSCFECSKVFENGKVFKNGDNFVCVDHKKATIPHKKPASRFADLD